MTNTDFDLTSLGITKEPETIEPEAYVPPFTEVNKDPVDAGTYTAKLVDGAFKLDGHTRPIRISSAKSKRNNQTYLAVSFVTEVQDAVVGGKNVGTKRVFTKVNTIPESLLFNEVKAGRENANSFMDALRAAGFTGSLQSNEDYINALLELIEQNALVRQRLDWNAYSNPNSTEYAGTGETVRGMKNFPLKPDGSHDPRIKIGESVILAQNETKAFYPAKKNG